MWYAMPWTEEEKSTKCDKKVENITTRQEYIVELARDGVCVHDIYKQAGFSSIQSFYRWRVKHPEFHRYLKRIIRERKREEITSREERLFDGFPQDAEEIERRAKIIRAMRERSTEPQGRGGMP